MTHRSSSKTDLGTGWGLSSILISATALWNVDHNQLPFLAMQNFPIKQVQASMFSIDSICVLSCCWVQRRPSNLLRGHLLCPVLSCKVRAKCQDPNNSPRRWKGSHFLPLVGHRPQATPNWTSKSELLPSVQLCLLGISHCNALFLGSHSIEFDIWWTIGITSPMAIECTQIYLLPSHEGLQGGGVCTFFSAPLKQLNTHALYSKSKAMWPMSWTNTSDEQWERSWSKSWGYFSNLHSYETLWCRHAAQPQWCTDILRPSWWRMAFIIIFLPIFGFTLLSRTLVFITA